MPDADETIKIILTAENVNVIETSTEVREIMNEVKEQMKELALTTKDSFDVINKSINIERIKELQEAIKEAKDELKGVGPAEKALKLEGIKQAEQDLKEFRAASTLALKETNAEARQFVKIMEMFKNINIAATAKQFKEVRREVKETSSTLRDTGNATQSFVGRINNMLSGLGQFGDVAKFVFGSILGVTAIQVLQRVTRAFVDFAKEILQRGVEMTEVMFTFEVAIRGLQRIGLDTTIAGWTTAIQDLKKEFPFFPKREFTEAASLAALMTREFGFTEKQIANIVRQSAILA